MREKICTRRRDNQSDRKSGYSTIIVLLGKSKVHAPFQFSAAQALTVFSRLQGTDTEFLYL